MKRYSIRDDSNNEMIELLNKHDAILGIQRSMGSISNQMIYTAPLGEFLEKNLDIAQGASELMVIGHQFNDYRDFMSRVNRILNNPTSDIDSFIAVLKSSKGLEYEQFHKRSVKDYTQRSIERFIENIVEVWNNAAERLEVDSSELVSRIDSLKNEYFKDRTYDTDLQTVDTVLEKINQIKVYDHIMSISNSEAALAMQPIRDKAFYDLKDLFLENKENPFLNVKENSRYFDVVGDKDIRQFLRSVDKVFFDLYHKFCDEGVMFEDDPFLPCYAVEMEREIKNKDSSAAFLWLKQNDGNINEVVYSSEGPIKEIIMFRDRSGGMIDRQGDYKVLPFQNHMVDAIRTMYRSVIEEDLKKNPSFKKAFIDKLEPNYYEYKNALKVIENYKNNEDLLKQGQFSLLEELKSSKSFEQIDDTIFKEVKKIAIVKLAHSISSNKYRHLYDDESYSAFSVFFEKGLGTEYLQEQIGRKMALFKTPDEFNSFLNTFLSKLDDFSPEIVEERCKREKASIISRENDIYIIKIDNYEQCTLLGSNSWCIVRDRDYFDSYTSDDHSQYIVYDFNKSSKDNESIIGFTLKNDGSYYTAHAKNDDHIRINNDLERHIEVVNDYQNDKKILDKIILRHNKI